MKKTYLLPLLMSFAMILPVGKTQAQKTGGVITFAVGAFRISTLSEGQHAGNTGMLTGATPDMLRQYYPDGTFPIETNAYLVRTPEQTVLVDAGYGKKLFANLQSTGVTPDQINAILLTHMHGDHIGGLLRDGKIAFPNAILYLSKQEYEYWLDGPNETARNVLAIYRDRLKLFTPEEPDSQTPNLFPGFQGIAAFGHTPGHTAFLLESGDARLLIWADLAHAMKIQMPHPEVALKFDVNPAQAVETRKRILNYVSENKLRIAGMHIEFPGVGDVTPQSQGGYQFTPVCLSEGL
jgi:glyoxylase-like metal-dependent hydrolase (beta-lactamase superfamily II)